MAYQSIELGTAANDGSGDTLRVGGDKVNDNFVEIYTALGTGTALSSGISASSTIITLTAPTISGVVGGTQTSATITTLNSTTLNGGTLALAAGSITDSSGAISFGNENLTTTGNLKVGDAGTIGSATTADAITIASDGDLAAKADFTVGALFKMPDVTTTKILVADGTSYQEVAMSGAATLANTGALTIANDAIDSQHYADGSIDNAHIADDAIDSEHYAAGSIDTAHIAADQIVASLIADDAIDSEHYTDGSIDTAHVADNAITLAKMAGGTDGNIISFDASGDPVAIATGNDGQVLTSAGAGAPPAFEAAAVGGPTLGTEQATTSGTSVTFSGIASGTTRIHLAFEKVGFAGSEVMLIQIGDSGGIETSGYEGGGTKVLGSASHETSAVTTCFPIRRTTTADDINGIMTLLHIGSNTWIASHACGGGTAGQNDGYHGGGNKTLSGELTQIQVSGGTFDLGTLNIFTE
jgi:hypothetical protein